MFYELKELIKEVLYYVFGDVVYEVDFRLIVLAVTAPFIIAFAYFLIRFIRRSILQPLTQNRRNIDQIAIMVTENNRLLRALQSETTNSNESNSN